jgi:integrase
MPRLGTRTRRAVGIYEDNLGYEAQVNGGRGKGNTKRFKRPATLAAMKRWQRDRRAELATATPEPPASQRGTLKADVSRFLALLPKGAKRHGYDVLLATWLETPLADKRRSAITRTDIQRQLAAWGSSGGRGQSGFAASTLNHRLSALRQLYRELDGADAPNPTLGIRRHTEPEPEPRGVPFAVAEQILARIKDRGGVKKPILPTKARIRLQVILFTGLPHAQVMRIKREHIDFEGATLVTTARRKGRGAQARRIPLLPQAVEALRAFDAADCYGTFATTPVRRAWNEARDKVAAEIADPAARALIAGLRPYDLRHSFLTAVYLHSGDHRATAELGLHSDDRTTRRYTLAAVTERARLALQAVQAGTQAGTARKPSDS